MRKPLILDSFLTAYKTNRRLLGGAFKTILSLSDEECGKIDFFLNNSGSWTDFGHLGSPEN